jgi:hypothetical protein
MYDSFYMETSKAFRTKSKKLAGTNYSEVYKKAYGIYSQIEKRSKRRPYIRSVYFNKDKIFLGLFWHHLKDKFNHKDKTRRLKYLPCALELISCSRYCPNSKQNPMKKSEIFHRFTGITTDNEIFFVQIKENKNNNHKYLISVFPLGT